MLFRSDCIDELQHDSDRAQAQTLALLDLLSSQRVELRRIQTTLNKTLEQLCPPGETSSDDAHLDALRRFRTTTNRPRQLQRLQWAKPGSW